KMTEMLTKRQREQLKGMRGKVFHLPDSVEPPLAVARPPMRKPGYPPELFGSYDFEIRYLWALMVWHELGTSDKQDELIKKAVEEWDDAYAGLRAPGIENVAAMHERTERALKDTLTAKQRKR